MAKWLIAWALLLLMLQSASWPALAASFNECLSEKGITLLVNGPCPPGSRLQRSGVDLPVPDQRNPKLLLNPRAIPDSTPSGDIDARVYDTLVMKRVCDVRMPGFRERSAVAYERWASAHAAAISKVEQRPDFQAQVANMQNGSGTDSDTQFVQQMCSDSFVARLLTESHAPNPKYATPELTWNTFVSALRAADRAAANDALDDDHERQKFEPILKQFSDQQLRDMGNSFNGFKLDQSYEPFTEAFVSRTNGRMGSVTFIKVLGEWKIYEM